ncbi:MAG: transposase family protein [Ramlibacter sp.]|nr:transposase family protein [Ramlibacter sp.]
MAEEREALPPEPDDKRERRPPKRRALPADLPRREVHHEPESTVCACRCQMKRISEDAHPLCEGGARDGQAGSTKDRFLPVQRQVIGMLGHQHLGHRRAVGMPLSMMCGAEFLGHPGGRAWRGAVPPGSATAKAVDLQPRALVRHMGDGNLPADNNRVENQIRPIAIGRNNWPFAGSLRVCRRAAAVMSLAHSAKLNTA